MIKKTLFICLWVTICASPARSQWTNMTPVNAENIQSLSVADDQNIFLLSRDSIPQLFKSQDSGTTWTAKNTPAWLNADPLYWTGIQFVDGQTGFIYGNWLVNGGVFSGGTEHFVLFKTTDGGATWQSLIQPLPNVGFDIIASLHFFNANQGVITLTTGLGYELVQTTADGGSSWQTADTLTSWNSTDHFDLNGTGYAIRNKGTNTLALYKIDDFGKTWTDLGVPGTDPNWPVQRIGLWFNQLLFANDTLAFRSRSDLNGLGVEDDIYLIDRSVDAGSNWEEGYFSQEKYTISHLEARSQYVFIGTFNQLYRRSLGLVHTDTPVFPSADFTLFPNPAAGNGQITLKNANIQEGGHEVLIYASNGHLVFSKQVFMQEADTPLVLPGLTSGFYEVQITANKRIVGSTSLMIH